MSRVASLARLQELDLETDRAAARRAEVQQKLDSDGAAHLASEIFAAMEAKAIEARRITREREDGVASLRAKIEETEKKLYGGTIQVPKELQDLQREAEALARHLQTLEDDLLQAMMDTEDAEGGLRLAKARSEEAEREQDERAAIWERELQAVDAQLDRLRGEIEAASGDVLEADLTLYNDLRRHLGRPVARLQDDVCGACGVALPASMPQAVRKGGDIVRCPQCGRILYAG
jgi:predicted  nucleic acid-binding Zn-ribbon protein